MANLKQVAKIFCSDLMHIDIGILLLLLRITQFDKWEEVPSAKFIYLLIDLLEVHKGL